MIPEHPFFSERVGAYVHPEGSVSFDSRGAALGSGGSLRLGGEREEEDVAPRPDDSSCRLAVFPTPLWITVGKSGDKWRSRWISGTMHPSPIPVLREVPVLNRVRLWTLFEMRRLVMVVCGVPGALRAQPGCEGAAGHSGALP